MFPGIQILESLPGTDPGTIRFHVVHPSDGRHFFMQFYPLDIQDPNQATRFEAAGYRVQAIQSVKHPNVANIVHFAQVDCYAMLITEWLAGESLTSYLQRRTEIETDPSLKLIFDLSEGLNQMHMMGLVHGGLRPEAIWLTSNGQIILEGFGLGDLLAGKKLHETTDRCQDAPECRYSLLLADDPRSDIFSLGVVGYQILLGELPEGQFIERPSRKHRTGAWLDQLILKAMNLDMAMRHQTIEDFQHDFQSRNLKDVEWTPKPLLEEAKPTRRRNEVENGEFSRLWLWLGLGFAAVVGLSILAGSILWANKDEAAISLQEATALLLKAALESKDLSDSEIESLLAKAATASGTDKAMALQTVTERMISQEKYKEAVDFGKRFLDVAGGEKKSKNRELAQVVQSNSKRINEFYAFSETADSARRLGKYQEEKEALEEGLKLIPTDRRLKRHLARNPLVFLVNYNLVLSQLAKLNPLQKDWHVSYYYDAEDLELDLSDHPELHDIAPVARLDVSEIDLSWTQVRDIKPLAGMDLHALRMDYSFVQDFSSLERMPLRLLSFPGTPVKNLSVLDKLVHLDSVRGRAGEATHFRIETPRWGKKWENSLGLRFRPIDENGPLFSIWETRQIDYANFVAEKNGKEGQEEASKLRQQALLPVNGITLEEAAEYCLWLTSRERRLGMIEGTTSYRMPTLEESKALSQLVKEALPLAEISSAVRPLITPIEEPETAAVTKIKPAQGQAKTGEKNAKPKNLTERDPMEDTELKEIENSTAKIHNVGRSLPARGFFDVDSNANEWWTNDKQLYNASNLAIMKARAGIRAAAKSSAKGAEPTTGGPSKSGLRLVLDFGKPRPKQ